MKISVIIPVYNAENFVTKAVKSALSQPETGEIVLVEDGSPDKSLEICQKLEKKYSIVRLLRHPNGENKGPGATRNLGIKNATCKFVAFLDADDFYCSDRFEKECEMFKNSQTEGVYGGTGFHIYSEEAYKIYQNGSYFNKRGLTSVNQIIPAAELPYKLLGVAKRNGQSGYFHLDALTVRCDVFKKAGFFNPKLQVHQDTEWILRLALTSRVETGAYKNAVAKRGIHDNNRISKVNNRDITRYLMYSAILEWAVNNNIDSHFITIIKQRKKAYKFRKESKTPLDQKQIWKYLKNHPRLIFNRGAFNILLKDLKRNTKHISLPLKGSIFISRVQASLKRRGYTMLHKSLRT